MDTERELREQGDARLNRRLRKHHGRLKKLEEAGVIVGDSLKKIAFNAKVNNGLTLIIACVLVAIRWPEAVPLLWAVFKKAMGM